ncbi:uncharacterized protein LOC120343971 [Styela clava]
MNTDSPLSTPTKCGCAGGIVVSCGTETVTRNKSRLQQKRLKRSRTSTAVVECPMCTHEQLQNHGCLDKKSDKIDMNLTTEIPLTETDSSTEKRWYDTMLRGLGIWSVKKRNRSPKCRVARINSTHADTVYEVSNICTNNNCKSVNRCESNHSSQGTDESITQMPSAEVTGTLNLNKEDSKLSDCKLNTSHTVHKHPDSSVEGKIPIGGGYSESDTHFSTGIGVNCMSETPPTAVMRRAKLVAGDTQSEQRLHSDSSGPGQKLPRLPYSETGNDDKKSTPSTADNNKRRRGKRKYFSSPIHKKDSTRERNKVQSTYVSFQDDLVDDAYMNIDSRQDIMSISVRSDSFSSGSPFQQSPSSMNDDVFGTESYIGATLPVTYANESDRMGGTKKDLEDVRIANLFQRVNTAFDPESHSAHYEQYNAGKFGQKGRMYTSDIRHRRMDHNLGNSKCRVHNCTNRAHTENQVEHIETIMASADLHASLDNAISILNESTRLLLPNDNSEWNHYDFNTKNQSTFSNGAGLHQQIRSRTYSTCSRLETIAEENDKSEETVIDGNFNNSGDTMSCTFSESSEYDKLYLHTSRPNSFFSSATTFTRDSDSITSSLYRHHSEGPIIGLHKQKGSISAFSSGATRNNSTSTISVRSLQRRKNAGMNSGNLSSPISNDNCAACEWVNRAQIQSSTTIPTAEWKWITKEMTPCLNKTHIHPWGMCSEQQNQPVLCHSHYLQYYQYLQNDHYKDNRGRRLHSASSQADSVIDYDIHEVMSSMDELALSSAESGVTNIKRSIVKNEQLFSDGNNQVTMSQSNMRAQCLDIRLHRKQSYHKHSDTDVSVNSDSAFSTNGSLTPSTRDGVNTDRDSVDSIAETNDLNDHDDATLNEAGGASHIGSSVINHNPWEQAEYSNNSNAECHPVLRTIQASVDYLPRGKRTQSYDDARSGNDFTKDPLSSCEKRYSVVSSLGSYPVALISDPLGDSAVHLQDSSSSHSTHLSSDSFYSSGTSFGDKETCLIDGALATDVLSRSSSETSLKSEGTLCLSEYARSQQNVSLFSIPSFPQISELCSPTHYQNTTKKTLHESLITESNNFDEFQEWVEKAEITESVLESFLNSSLAHMKIMESMELSNTQSEKSNAPVQNTDTLTSSSGSSDTNTLGSGSSGSTYATSSLRSYRSRFNTFDSSSCVSTDDTGDTVIDQYMLRPNYRLDDIDESPAGQNYISQSKKTADANKIRYQSSAFHYQNLELPSPQYCEEQQTLHHGTSTDKLSSKIDLENGAIHIAVTKDVTKNTQIIVTSPRTRSSSMSCIMTSVTKTSCIVRQTKSLPRISLNHYQDEVKETGCSISFSPSKMNANTFQPPLTPVYGPVLQTKVQSMMKNCANIDSVITSLRESLKTATNSDTGDFVDKKLIELSDILKQKDEMINQLHRMLLACSVPDKSIGHHKYQINATL